MQRVQVIFKDCIGYLRNNKISAIKAIRQAGVDFLKQTVGLREAKEVMDNLCNGWSGTLIAEVPDGGDLRGFIGNLRDIGFQVECPTAGLDKPIGFKGVVMEAVEAGNFKYAKALLDAHIKYGGADEA